MAAIGSRVDAGIFYSRPLLDVGLWPFLRVRKFPEKSPGREGGEFFVTIFFCFSVVFFFFRGNEVASEKCVSSSLLLLLLLVLSPMQQVWCF